jgi:hypothetical protein
MVLVVLALWLLPLAAHAFAGANGVVGAANAGSFDRNAFGGAARRAENDAAWRAHLRGSAVGVDFVDELGSERAIAPQTEFGWVESVDLHDPITDILKNLSATIGFSTICAGSLVMSNHLQG